MDDEALKSTLQAPATDPEALRLALEAWQEASRTLRIRPTREQAATVRRLTAQLDHQPAPSLGR